MAKYDPEIDTKFSDYYAVLISTGELAEEYGRRLSLCAKNELMARTLIQFARLAVETPDSVLRLLRSGELAPCYVILRWHLEMSHLCYYLWQNPTEHTLWLKGKRIRPRQVGKFFETRGFATWKHAYEDWSNVVHGNNLFVDKLHVTSCRSEKTDAGVMLVGNAFVNLIWVTHKFNYVLGKYLISQRGTEMDELSRRYNSLEERVFEVTKMQHTLKNNVMNDKKS